MKRLFLTTTFVLALVLPGLAMEGMSRQTGPLTIKAGGFDVSIEVMTHKEYQDMMNMMKMKPMKQEKGTTHHIAATIRRDGQKAEAATVIMGVVSPDGKEERKALSYNPDMMSQHVGHFNMPKKGKYQITITFEAGKEKHQGGVHYKIK